MSYEPGCRTYCTGSDLTCEPIKTLPELTKFLVEPPIWRTLCQPLFPHSKYLLNSNEVELAPSPDGSCGDVTVETQMRFCHFNPKHDRASTRYEEGELPKLLVCHDMDNNYHVEDSTVDGSPNYDAYSFYNWAAVDIFCYFSHHLITIPPLGWINAAHAHGVKVIGTFITEHNDGISFWNKVFANEGLGIDFLVSALVTIAKTLKFEGWLLNIENKISEPEELLKFVENLAKAVRQEVPGGVVIWYDSVTTEGHLTWQNKLNEKNRPFFDACDGIFTNYSWDETDVRTSAHVAGTRLKDLYIGIDVWGRNFFGGGMFNTQEAVKLVHKYGCSMAVFAPAWTHEALVLEDDEDDPDSVAMAEDLTKIERFWIRDRALWGSLWPFLKTRLPNVLPFKTSFCRGNGIKRRLYGEVLCNYPWYNLRHMQYQPNAAHGPHGYVLTSVEKILHASRMVATDTKRRQSLRASIIALNRAENDVSDHEPRLEHRRSIIKREKSDEYFLKNNKFGGYIGSTSILHMNEPRMVKVKRAIKNMFAKIVGSQRQSINEKNDEQNIETKERHNIDTNRIQSSVTNLKQNITNNKTQSIETNEKQNIVTKEEQNIGTSDKLNIDSNEKLNISNIEKQNNGHNEKLNIGSNEKQNIGTNEKQNIDSNENQSIGTNENQNIVTKNQNIVTKKLSIDSNENQSISTKEKQSKEKRSVATNELQNIKETSTMNDVENQKDESCSSEPSASLYYRTMQPSVQVRLGMDKTRYTVAYVAEERECIECWLNDSFIGGGCLKINPSDLDYDEHRMIRLFHSDFRIKAGDSLVVCMVTKTLPGFHQWLNMWLYASTVFGRTRMELVGNSDSNRGEGEGTSKSVHQMCYPLNPHSYQFQELRTHLLVKQPDFYLSPENSYGWKIMYFELPMEVETRITSINLRTEHSRGGILLGHVGLCTRR